MDTHSYNEDAVIVAGDVEIPVRAQLKKRYTRERQESWSGTLFVEDASVDLYPLHESDDLVLRLPDGREGRFMADWTIVDGVAGPITIRGSGRAPF